MQDVQKIHCRFDDFEALTETIRGWNLELHKLEAGAFRAELYQIIDPDLLLTGGFFSSRLMQTGAPPHGYRTFVIPNTVPFRLLWRGRQVMENDLLIFPPGGELHAFSNPGFSVFTLSVPEAVLCEWIHPEVLNGIEVLSCKPPSMNRLRRQLKAVKCMSRLNKEIIFRGLAMLTAESLPAKNVQTKKATRLEILHRAEQIILSSPDEALSVNEVSRLTGVSKRTLEYTFSSQLGMAPKRFINTVRLNGVRKLLRSGHTRKVADAANAWGFWHMGQFAADYRTLFGELPSETLAEPAIR